MKLNYFSIIIFLEIIIFLIGCPNAIEERNDADSPPAFYDVTIDKTTVHIGDSLTVKYYTEQTSAAESNFIKAKVVDDKLLGISGYDYTDIIFFNVDVSDDLVESTYIDNHRLDHVDHDKGWYELPSVRSEKVTYYNFDEQTRITTVTVIVPNGAKTGFVKINDNRSIRGIGFCPTKLTVIE